MTLRPPYRPLDTVYTENSIQRFPRQRSHCYFPVTFLPQAPVPFLHVADFKEVRRGWDLRDTQLHIQKNNLRKLTRADQTASNLP